MKFSIYQLSRIGGREKNEDRMGYSYTREAGLFVLADGMGGHPDGEVAAQLALQSFSVRFQQHARPRLEAPANFLATGVLAAHHEIVRHASARALLDTPRTTIVAAAIQDDTLHWVHSGDSRLYVIRDGGLLTRTRDHSYQEAMGSNGMPAALNRNMLFTCLGSVARPTFDAGGPLRLTRGDCILLCSDGLWDSVEEMDIVETLSSLRVEEAVPELVNQALVTAGAHSDNVTALALTWEAQQPEAPGSGFTQTGWMADEEFASTVQGESLDDFDELEIERSIAEINEAIKRSGLRK